MSNEESNEETSEGTGAGESRQRDPQRVDVQVSVGFGAAQSYGSDWIAWAQTEPPPQIGGVDPGLNPNFSDPNGQSGEAYA